MRNRADQSRNARPRRVALALPAGVAYLERLLAGVAAYGRPRGWAFTRIGEALVHSTRWLRGWDGDGAIAWVLRRDEDRLLARLPFPVVNVASRLDGLRTPSVHVDHRAMGALAAAHLAGRPLRSCGYLGVAGMWFSAERRQGFAAALAGRGLPLSALDLPIAPGSGGWPAVLRRLEAWLAGLERPAGVFACNDVRGAMVLDACARLGLAVPAAVAVVAVEDSTATCTACSPTLSGIDRNDQRLGQAAAALLERLMAGGDAGTPPPEPPGPLSVRGSSAPGASGDPEVDRCLAWIHEHLAEPIGTDDLARLLGRSRRATELLFRRVLDQPPYQVVCRLRVERARTLLAGPQPVAAVAAACGLGDPRVFRRLFRRHTGLAPAAFRAGAAEDGRRE